MPWRWATCVEATGQINGDRSKVPREGADDLTPRAEEFDTQKACINVDHIDENSGAACGERRLARYLASNLQRN